MSKLVQRQKCSYDGQNIEHPASCQLKIFFSASPEKSQSNHEENLDGSPVTGLLYEEVLPLLQQLIGLRSQ